MTNKEIIEQIKKNLVGDRNADVNYLQTELKLYKEMKNEEVVFAISNMLFEYLSPEVKKRLDSQVHGILKKHHDEYIKANDLMNQGKLQEAKEILLRLVAMFNKISNLGDQKLFDFSQSIEYFLYCETVERMRNLKIKRIPEPVTYYCYQLATIALEENNHDEAIMYLEKALKFNPRCQYVMQELVDQYQHQNLLDKMYDLLKISLKYSYTKAQLAFCYQKLGWYFNQKCRYDLAIACYSVSDHYQYDAENKKNVQKIVEKAGYIKFNNVQELLKIFKDEDLNYGPSTVVMQVFSDFVKYAKALKDYNTAKYLLTIAYELTSADVFKKDLDALEGEMKNDKERKN